MAAATNNSVLSRLDKSFLKNLEKSLGNRTATNAPKVVSRSQSTPGGWRDQYQNEPKQLTNEEYRSMDRYSVVSENFFY